MLLPLLLLQLPPEESRLAHTHTCTCWDNKQEVRISCTSLWAQPARNFVRTSLSLSLRSVQMSRQRRQTTFDTKVLKTVFLSQVSFGTLACYSHYLPLPLSLSLFLHCPRCQINWKWLDLWGSQAFGVLPSAVVCVPWSWRCPWTCSPNATSITWRHSQLATPWPSPPPFWLAQMSFVSQVDPAEIKWAFNLPTLAGVAPPPPSLAENCVNVIPAWRMLAFFFAKTHPLPLSSHSVHNSLVCFFFLFCCFLSLGWRHGGCSAGFCLPGRFSLKQVSFSLSFRLPLCPDLLTACLPALISARYFNLINRVNNTSRDCLSYFFWLLFFGGYKSVIIHSNL